VSKPKKSSVNLEVTPETKQLLDDFKKNDGFSKGSILDDGVVWARFLFYSTEDLPTTKREVMIYRSLQSTRKYHAEQGAPASVLAGLDDAIKFQKQIVDSLETGEYKKIKQNLEKKSLE
jgi:hypothetical protein